MYAALWRVLPGPWWLRAILLLVLLIVLLIVLTQWVFPVVDRYVNNQEVTVGAAQSPRSHW
jgi:membrane protein implicated in regulation of membrane protease activity